MRGAQGANLPLSGIGFKKCTAEMDERRRPRAPDNRGHRYETSYFVTIDPVAVKVIAPKSPFVPGGVPGAASVLP